MLAFARHRSLLALPLCLSSCFNGADALHLPCTASNQCGLGQSCIEGFCDGPPDGYTACGNGIQEEGEECDDGPENADENACKSDCTDQVCGDGFIGPNEDCDDSNAQSGDGCDSECQSEACGNGQVDEGEQCDEGEDNGENAPCNPQCQDSVCGDGFVWEDDGEQCDPGPDENETAECDSDCTIPECGDELVNVASGEGPGCDPPPLVDDDECTPSCTAPLFWEDAEETLADQWTTEVVVGPAEALWSFSGLESYQGARSIASGPPPNDAVAGPGQNRLVTGPIQLPEERRAYVRFFHQIDLSICPGTEADGLRVVVSTDGGQNFEVLPDHPSAILESPVDCPDGEKNPLADMPAFTSMDNRDFGNEFTDAVTLDLEDYMGQEILLGLEVAWDCDDCGVGGDGWNIDNLVVFATPFYDPD